MGFLFFFALCLSLLAFTLVSSATTGYGLAYHDVTGLKLSTSAESVVELALLAVFDPTTPEPQSDLTALKEELFERLQAAIGSTGGSSVSTALAGVQATRRIDPSRLGLSAGASSDVAVEQVMATLHSFRPIVHGDGGAYDIPEAFYGEPAFEDLKKDRVPRDFTGYLTLSVTVATRERGLSTRRVVQVIRDVKVLDVTPPAREFALFSYGVPRDVPHMLNDLNTGGRMTTYPLGSRVLVRGPMFLKVEDASDPVHIGGEYRGRDSLSYPERGRDWHGWAFIPGPRAVHNSNFAGDIREMLGGLGPLLAGQGWTAHPRRPPSEADRARASILGFQFPGVLLVGPALGPAIGAFFPIPPDETIACSNPWVYLTGTVPPSRQRFSICGAPDPLRGPAASSRVSMFSGILTKKGGASKGIYQENLRFPHVAYGGGARVEDGDAIYPEPFDYGTLSTRQEAPPTDRGIAGYPSDQGIYGIYKIASFKREPVWSEQLLRFVSKHYPPAGVLVLSAQSILRAMGWNPDIHLILVHWAATAAPDLVSELRQEFMDQVIARKQYFVAPYGLYFESSMNRNVLEEVRTVLTAAGFTLLSGKVTGFIVGRIFRPASAPAGQVRPGDKAVDALKDKVFTQVTPKHADTLSGLTHGVLVWASKTFVSQGINSLLTEIMKATFKGAVEGLSFVATWKVVGFLRIRRLRRALDEIASWTPPPTVGELKREFPKGLLPPKYRSYERIATRAYGTFQELVTDRTQDGVLQLSEVMLVRELDWRSAQPLRYSGRGVIVALGGRGTEPPVLDAPVLRADPRSYLTLVFEDLAMTTLERPTARMLALGPVFQGTVYATSGVRPAAGKSLIAGNLVAFHINKGKIDESDTLEVVYDRDRLPLATDRARQKDWWILSVSRRSAGLAGE
ncbi:MAG: hypothetical protein HY815_21025 [Candidatus Riflebacteria bacterium]|nr:hypothetical protein [Candidatus Riflebacteria bacterium]